MIPVSEFSGRDVAVLGLGRTGLATVRALTAGGANVLAWDDNEETRAKAEASGIRLTDLNRRDWQTMAALVLSPGIPSRFPHAHRLVEMAHMVDVPVIGDMELFARALSAMPEQARPRVIGITGTNGKSTTTALIGHILASAGRDVRVGGNIGIGVLDMEPLHQNAVYVLELSSYQLDLVETLRCDVAVVLNITPDHLDRHGGMAGYIAAKRRIFDNQQRGDTAIVGMDTGPTQRICMDLLAHGQQTIVGISSQMALGRGVSVRDGRLYDSQAGRAASVGDIGQVATLRGRHNQQNAAAAFAACQAIGLEAPAILDGMRSFAGLAHRQELAGTIGHVRFVNDSKATNGKAAVQAVQAFEDIFWIAGGVAKEDGLEAVLPYLSHVRKAYLIGQAASVSSGKSTARFRASIFRHSRRPPLPPMQTPQVRTPLRLSCCCLRLVPVSTSFGTSSIAAMSSRTRFWRWSTSEPERRRA